MNAPDLFSLGGRQDDADAELFVLLAEYDHLMDRRCEVDAAAEAREWALPKAKVEIGKLIIRGESEPIYATTVEKIAQQFDPPPSTLYKADEVEEILGISRKFYRDRCDDLIADLQAQQTVIAERRRAERIDELYAEAQEYGALADNALAKAASYRPVTIRGVIEMLNRSEEYGNGQMFDNAIAALQDIAERAGLS